MVMRRYFYQKKFLSKKSFPVRNRLDETAATLQEKGRTRRPLTRTAAITLWR
jgi:hypothetical protein